MWNFWISSIRRRYLCSRSLSSDPRISSSEMSVDAVQLCFIVGGSSIGVGELSGKLWLYIHIRSWTIMTRQIPDVPAGEGDSPFSPVWTGSHSSCAAFGQSASWCLGWGFESPLGYKKWTIKIWRWSTLKVIKFPLTWWCCRSIRWKPGVLLLGQCSWHQTAFPEWWRISKGGISISELHFLSIFILFRAATISQIIDD